MWIQHISRRGLYTGKHGAKEKKKSSLNRKFCTGASRGRANVSAFCRLQFAECYYRQKFGGGDVGKGYESLATAGISVSDYVPSLSWGETLSSNLSTCNPETAGLVTITGPGKKTLQSHYNNDSNSGQERHNLSRPSLLLHQLPLLFRTNYTLTFNPILFIYLFIFQTSAFKLDMQDGTFQRCQLFNRSMAWSPQKSIKNKENEGDGDSRTVNQTNSKIPSQQYYVRGQ